MYAACELIARVGLHPSYEAETSHIWSVVCENAAGNLVVIRIRSLICCLTVVCALLPEDRPLRLLPATTNTVGIHRVKTTPTRRVDKSPAIN